MGPKWKALLLSSEDLSHSWERLDQFEGDGYARVQASVRRRGGGTAVAHIYVLNGQSEVSAPNPSAS